MANLAVASAECQARPILPPQRLKMEGKPIPSRHPDYPLLTWKQKEAKRIAETKPMATSSSGEEQGTVACANLEIPTDMVRVSPAQHQCILCQKLLTSARGLNDHLQMKHGQQKSKDELLAKIEQKEKELAEIRSIRRHWRWKIQP